MTLIMASVTIVLFLTLASGLWIWAAILFTGIVSLESFKSLPVEKLLAPNFLDTTTSESLLVLPLFVLMAEILFRSKLSERLFEGLAPIASYLPGQLLHTNIIGCTLFAATCGSSAATTLTVGRVTYSELLKRGYDKRMAMGTLAGPGTLGLLIPPSTILIVYGILSDTSILKLFLSGFLPGVLLAALFSGYVIVSAWIWPSRFPKQTTKYSFVEVMRGLVSVAPVLGLVVMIMGAMYFGIASPTETATFGVLGAILISASQRTLTLTSIKEALRASVMMTSMLGCIIAAAVFLGTAMGFLGIPRAVAQMMEPLSDQPYLLVFVLLLFYIVLGFFLEGVSIVVMTLPIILPVVIAAGFDTIWFGIFLVLVVEMAQITPPLGFNIFVLQGLTKERVGQIVVAVMPFFAILILFVGLITLFPGIATFGASL